VSKAIRIIEVSVFFLVIVTTGKLYTLPKEVFPYSPPGYYEVGEREWDGRSNPIVHTGEYEFCEGGYGDILFKNVISSALLCYIAYRVGRLSLMCLVDNYAPVEVFWLFGAGSLILYNMGWICRLTHWPYVGALSIILFICSGIAFFISLFVRCEKCEG
jgi:hypothetical protein